MSTRKLLSLFIVAMLTLFVLAACGGGNQGADATPEAAPTPAQETQAPETQPDEEEQITIVIGMMANVMMEDPDTNWLTLYIQERTGFNIEFDIFPMDTSDALTRFTLMVAGGQRLPCVTILPFNEAMVWEYVEAGVFQPITDWWNNPETAPNVANMIDEDRIPLTQALTMPDGHIYTIPVFARSPWNEMPFRSWINRDWLDNLGLDMPTTTDELRNVLYAFVNNDPNGTGNRTIGMTGGGGWGANPLPFLMNAFTYANPDTFWLHVEDGIVYSVHSRPEFRDGLEFIYGLVRDGLLETDAFVQSMAELQAITMAEEALAGVVTGGSYSGLFGPSGPAFDRVALMPPLIGPQGVQHAPRIAPLPSHSSAWQITRDAENAFAAFQVGEMFMGEYWSRVFASGQEDVHWSRDPEILATWRGRFTDVPDVAVVFVDTNPWGRPGNVIWGAGPRYNSWRIVRGTGFMPMDEYLAAGQPEFLQAVHYRLYMPHIPEDVIGRRVFTAEEMAEVATIQTLLMEHITANNAAFATGQRPLSDYDTFLQELDALGMQRFIQLTQNGHNRNLGLPATY